MGYATASVLVAWLVGRSARVRVAAACVAGAVTVLLVGGATVATAGSTGADVPLPPYPATWTGQVAARLADPLLYRVELALIVPSAVVLFLAGSALLRAGLFDAGATTLRRRMIGTGVAGALLTVLTTLGGDPWFLVERYLVAPLVALGLLGLVPEVLARLRGPAGPVRCGLIALGRTAMSCYVGQNVVAAVLFGAWGLGVAGALAGVAAPLRTGAVVGMWVLVVAGSAAAAGWWLRRHDRGPLEALTQALLRGRSPASRRGARTP
nr:DUF418 domain-containing protein [Pseudonocardia sp. SID8383]